MLGLGNFRGHPRKFITGFIEKFIVHEDKMDEYGRALCVRGNHVYREIWEAAVSRETTSWLRYVELYG